MPKLLAFFICLIGVCPAGYGQTADTTANPPYWQALQSVKVLYDSVTQYSQHLYNGSRYFVYDSREVEHQFFASEDWLNGSVNYDGQLYRNVSIKYDIVKDLLIIRHYAGEGHISLQNDRVANFTIPDHVFYRLESGKEINPEMRTGFYDLLYEGKSRVIVRRHKIRQERIENIKVIAQFPERDFFYILKGDIFYPVYSKKSAFGLFKGQKKNLKKHLRKNNLKFKKHREEAIVKMAVYYDELNRQ